MRDLRKYEELFPEEFDAEMKKTPVLYCAFGPMEYHGIYNTLGIDPGKAYEICLRAAALSGGVVFPMIPIAPGGSMAYEKMFNRADFRKTERKILYPGVMTGVDLCEKLYSELFESFAEDLGVKVCVAFGGHGPAGVVIKKICDDHQGEISGMKILPCSSLSHNMDVVKSDYEKLGVEKVSHGGLWETAMNKGTNPDFVEQGRIDKPWPDYFVKYGEPTLDGLREIEPAALEAFGNKLLDVSAGRIADEAVNLLSRS